MSKEKVAVVGAGLVGSMQAMFLAQKGFDVHIFEYRSDLRTAELVSGKSINLALSNRGLKGLEVLGVKDEILKMAIPMYGRGIHIPGLEERYQPYGRNKECIYSVSRGGLNQRMLQLLDAYDNVSFYFEHKCTDADLDAGTVSFLDENNKEVHYTFDRIFATDGAFSKVRYAFQKKPRVDYSQTYLEHSYKEFLMPANADGSPKLDVNKLHIWPRGKFMFIALANLDHSYTCTLFFPAQGALSFETLKADQDIEQFFTQEFPEIKELIPDYLNQYKENVVGDLVTVRTNPWHYGDKIFLMGDAAHAIVPFYGQGMNAGFEDCFVLHQIMEKESNWSKIAEAYSAERVENGHAIADLAIYNYIEMRDKTADEMFLLQKKIEQKFANAYPDLWVPLYERVTFSDYSYADALNKGKEQGAIMAEVMKRPDIKDTWDSEAVMQTILDLLKLEKA